MNLLMLVMLASSMPIDMYVVLISGYFCYSGPGMLAGEIVAIV